MGKLERLNKIIELSKELDKKAFQEKAEEEKERYITEIVESKVTALVFHNRLSMEQIEGLSVDSAFKNALKALFYVMNDDYEEEYKHEHEQFLELKRLLDEEGINHDLLDKIRYYEIMRDLDNISLKVFFSEHRIEDYKAYDADTLATELYEVLYELYTKKRD